MKKRVIAAMLAAIMLLSQNSITTVFAKESDTIHQTENVSNIEDSQTEGTKIDTQLKTENTKEDTQITEGEKAEADTQDTITVENAVRLKEADTATDMADLAETEAATHTRLIVTSEEVLTECYGATECIRGYEDLNILTYADTASCESAYAQFLNAEFSVEYDDTMQAYDKDDCNDVEKTEESTIEEQSRETEAEETEAAKEKELTVAVIDTGIDTASELLKGRIKENTDGGDDITDNNGHGTLIAEIIASNTGENVKILPIKAFDENGTGTVSTTYLAIMEAVEKNVDIINLSVSGEGTSAMLTSAITKAKQAGISVIVAAGNNGSDTASFMPANIKDAITISASDENKEPAVYSNYGDAVDFCALGSAKKDNGTKDTTDDVTYSGTSFAAAYVSAYAAMILEQNRDADVEKCLTASAEDLGETGKDIYYGNGYLCKENLVSSITREETGDEANSSDDTENEDVITKEDGDQELSVSRSIKDKDFCVRNLGPNTTIRIKAVNDDNPNNKYQNWNDIIPNQGEIHYSLASNDSGCYDLSVTMSCDVTDWTPYLEIYTSRPGYRPIGWSNIVAGGTGMNHPCGEVHHWDDNWTQTSNGYYMLQYIGAGFFYDSITVNWEKIPYHVIYDVTGATYCDWGTLNSLNGNTYAFDMHHAVAENTFSNRYNRLNYNAAGGTCHSYDQGYSAFLGWDDNTVINTYSGDLVPDRQSTTTFNAAYYANIYPDLMRVYGYDKVALWGHWCSCGHTEGRSIRSGHSLNNLDRNDLYHPGVGFRNLTTTPGGSVTLTARWKDPVVTLPTPTRTGYTFLGWYNSSGRFVGKGGTSYTMSGTSTLTAKWKANTYQIKYDLNGATHVDTSALNTLNNKVYTYDTDYTFADANNIANKYNRLNYDTDGGNCTSETTGDSYDDAYSSFLGWDDDTVINTYSGDLVPDRQSTTTFNAAYYSNMNPDLLCGYDKKTLWWHYQNYGKKEGRSIRSGHNFENIDRNDLYHENTKFRNLADSKKTATVTARWKDPIVTLPDASRSGYTFLGWYDDAGNYIGMGGTSYTMSGTSTLHAKWDKIPEVDVEDLYFTLTEAQEGAITEEELLDYAAAYDKELKNTDNPAGELKRGTDETNKTSFVVMDYLESDFTSFTYNGSVTITYEATDAIGNTAKKMVTVHITDTDAHDPNWNEGKIRFISKKYLNTLEDNSIWVTNPEYRAELLDALSYERVNPKKNTLSIFGMKIEKEIPGTGEWNKEPEEVWEFTRKQADEVREFIDTYGPFNYKTENGLELFAEKFAKCRIK